MFELINNIQLVYKNEEIIIDARSYITDNEYEILTKTIQNIKI